MKTLTIRVFLCVSLVATTLLTAGCESVPQATVLPMADGQFKVIANGYDEQGAIRDAMTTANKRCEALGQEAYVLTSQSQYQGVDRNAAAIVDLISTAASAAGYPSHVTTHGKDDFKATLVVKCGPA